MSTVGIPNLDVQFWTQKSDLPQGNLLRFLTQPEITIQKIELMDIYYV